MMAGKLALLVSWNRRREWKCMKGRERPHELCTDVTYIAAAMTGPAAAAPRGAVRSPADAASVALLMPLSEAGHGSAGFAAGRPVQCRT